MRILQITEASSAGVGRHVVDLAGGLLARGHDVHLIYARRRIDATFDAETRALTGLKRHEIDMRRAPHPSDLGARLAVARYVRDHGPFDVVHAQSSKAGALARVPLRRLGRAVLYTPHCVYTMNPSISRRAYWLYRGIERTLARWTDCVIAVSPDEWQHLVDQGFPESRVRFIANGVDPWPLPDRSRLRSELGLAVDEPLIGFIGRFNEQKDPLRMVDVLAELRVPARLAMVGDGPLKDAAQVRARELGVDGRIHWLGFRSARDVLPAFDVLSLTSRYEGLPYVLLEALAAGVPVVSTPVGGAELLLGEGMGGTIAGGGSASELAAELDGLLGDADRLAATGEAAVARAAEFSIDAMVERTERAYLDCLSGREGAHGRPRATAPAGEDVTGFVRGPATCAAAGDEDA